MRSHRFLFLLLPLALVVVGGQPSPSRAQGADDGTWATILPPGISETTFAFDPGRARTFHFDAFGSTRDEVWLRPIDGSPWSRVRIEAPPFPRGAARLLYDAPSDRILALVAEDRQPIEIWAIAAGEPHAWVRLDSEGAPRSVYYAAITYDTRRARWLSFGGGWSGGDPPDSDDLWSLEVAGDRARWARIEPSGQLSEPRVHAYAAYDSASDRMFIVGGAYSVPSGGTMGASHDVYEVELSQGAQWSLVSRDVPISRTYRAQPVVDEARRRLLIAGSPQDTIRALSLDGSHTWSLLAPPDRPEPQARFVAIGTSADRRSFVAWTSEGSWTVPFADARFDSVYETPEDSTLGSQTTYILGRHPDRGTPLYIARYPRPMARTPAASVWSLDDRVPARWRPLEVAGTPPPSLEDYGSALDTRRGRWILLRATPGTNAAEVWTIDFRPTPHWSRLDCRSQAPEVASWAGVAYDPLADRLLVVPGTRTSATPPGLVAWSLDFARDNTWTRLEPSGRLPVGRGRSLTAFDPRANRLVLYGGYRMNPGGGIGGIALAGTYGSQTDLWTLSLGAEARWDSIAVSGDSLTTASGGTLEFDPGRGSFLLAASDASTFEGPRLGFQAYELTPGDGAWQSRRFSGPRELTSFSAKRAVYISERDRLFAVEDRADRTYVLDRSHPSRLVPVAMDLAPGSSTAKAASTRGPDVAAALLTGWDFDPFTPAIVEVALDGTTGHVLNGGRARRDADGDGRADRWFAFERAALGLVSGERTFELRARTAEGVTLVGFADAMIADRPGPGHAAEVGDVDAGHLAFGVQLDTPLRTGGGLRLTLPGERAVTIEVFAVDGRRVASAAPVHYEAGHHRIALPAVARLGPGIYWARVRAGSDAWTGRVVRVD